MDVQRVKDLVIPPAWTDVWICPDEKGHLQAVGTDDAGRTQYLYHPAWREKQDSAKFDRVLDMARRLPGVRRKLRRALTGPPTGRDQVLAVAVRLVDLGCFRLGSEASAEESGSYGLTTLERRHVRRDGKDLVFSFVGKSGIEQEVRVDDPAVRRVVEAVTRGRRASAHLLATKEKGRWRALEPGDVNDYIRGLFGMDVTAKDFRTWHATVTVAAALAATERAATKRGRATQVREAVVEAAELLGNTPSVARSSYVDPRVVDRFEAGQTMKLARGQDAIDRSVVRLLR